jgi:putative hydrolase of the HAD superfamily
MKAVIFDLGGVVVRWDPERFSRDYLQNEVEKKDVLLRLLGHDDWRRFDGGFLSEDELMQAFCARSSVSQERTIEIIECIKQSLELIEETNELIYELKAAGVPLYCISNMSFAHYDFLREKYDFFECFNDQVISSHVKMTKPDKNIYELAIQQFGVDPQSTVFVDDREDNILAAESCGLGVVHFERSATCRQNIRDFVGI